SVFNGLKAMLASGLDGQDWVLGHDAARCLVEPEAVCRLINTCRDDNVGGLLALPLPDTLKSEVNGRVQQTVPREHKWLAQTPQMFRLQALHDALAAVASSGFAGITDEASAMERLGLQPRLVEGSAQNFKVTYPADFVLAEAILRSRT
ncbi:MAG: 2-C-methyl-D-erythritol 4-phosphate cytidylyltransferase, partial [Limnohabitans sp.]